MSFISSVSHLPWFAPLVVLVSIGVSMVVSQCIKYLLDPRNFSTFGKDGGMPSTHSTIVSATLTGIFLTQGLSMLFVLASAVGVIILRDAFGVRYAVGENAKVLRELADGELERRVIIDEGHKPIQIFVGLVLGCIISFTFISLFGLSFFW